MGEEKVKMFFLPGTDLIKQISDRVPLSFLHWEKCLFRHFVHMTTHSYVHLHATPRARTELIFPFVRIKKLYSKLTIRTSGELISKFLSPRLRSYRRTHFVCA